MVDVVVVGGGLAGLAAAWHLRDLDVLVLEAEERVGGRVRSEPRDDVWLNFGAHVFAGPGTAWGRLIDETGVTAVPVPGHLAAVALGKQIVAGGAVETYPFRLPLSLRSRASLIRAGMRLRLAVRRYAAVAAERPGEDAAAHRQRILEHLDDRSFSDFIGPLPADVDAIFRATLNRSSGEPEELAAGYGIGYFHLVWNRGEGLSRNILGGPGTLIEALARVPIVTGARVTDVRKDGDGILVRYGQSEVRARAAVVATPAFVTREIVRDLPAQHCGRARRGALRPVRRRCVPHRRGRADAVAQPVRPRHPGALVQHGLQHRERPASGREPDGLRGRHGRSRTRRARRRRGARAIPGRPRRSLSTHTPFRPGGRDPALAARASVCGGRSRPPSGTADATARADPPRRRLPGHVLHRNGGANCRAGCRRGSPALARGTQSTKFWKVTLHQEASASVREALRDRLGDPDLVVVDVRPLYAYNGWRRPCASRGGHIPGAVAFPSAWLASVEEEEVERLLEAKGIVPTHDVMVYGDRPEEVDAVVSRLASLGHTGLTSFVLAEWEADPELPLERLPNYDKLVHSDWLSDLLDGGRPEAAPAGSFRLFHVNFGVPEEYEENHLPGAFYLDTNLLEDPADWNRRSPEELKVALRALGITRDTTVILYGRDTEGHADEKWPGRRAGQIAATRAALILHYAGVDDVRLLDGGYDAWVQSGKPLETTLREPVPAAAFGAPIPSRPQAIVDLDEAKEILSDPDNAALVSVRTWNEHIGKNSGYNYIAPAGRIAGDVWGNCGSDAYHMQHYRTIDNTMRAYPEIAANWEEAGITPDKWVAFYCGTGWRASETWFYAYLMGWKGIAVYDGAGSSGAGTH